jgi:hypothetical protein
MLDIYLFDSASCPGGVAVYGHLLFQFRMFLEDTSEFIKDARIGILHGIEHAADHLAVGDRPAIS